ncbi:NodT family RND efflux system outer membrane lipoprotein [Klebsiella pneumoniae]|nr:NodT family RND efflux system outer membrane lipoprotein [Klebsiella pneumoniae]
MAADATLASSQAQLLPSINLTATGSLQDRTLPDLLDNPLRLWSLGGSILAPLLNRQALNAQVDLSMAQRNQALYSYEKTVRSAFKEVNDSLDAIQSLWRTVNRASGTRDRCPGNLTYCTKPLP